MRISPQSPRSNRSRAASKAGHFQPVGLVDQNQARRIGDGRLLLHKRAHQRRVVRFRRQRQSLRAHVAREVKPGAALPLVVDARFGRCRTLRSVEGFEGDPVQQPPAAPDFVTDTARGVDHARRIEERGGRPQRAHLRVRQSVYIDGLQRLPTRIPARRERFAHPWRPVTQADIAIVPAGVAEFGETPVLHRLDKGLPHRRALIRCGSV